MAETAQAIVTESAFDRGQFARRADWLAIAVAVALPWSTSISAILIVLWGVALLPTLDLAALRRDFATAAGALPVALLALAIIGMAWADVTFAERFDSLKVFARLLAIPLLFVQFRRSDRGMWVIGGYLASCTALLAASWVSAIWPSLAWRKEWPGIPVKDYIVQSGEFLICSFGLLHIAIENWRQSRRGLALALGLLALVFLANIFFVATGRSSLVVLAVLLLVLGLQRFSWKGTLGVVMAGATLAALGWFSSPYVQMRVLSAVQEVRDYQTEGAASPAGFRLEFWKKSIEFVAAAPIIGHGVGSVRKLFREAATDGKGASSGITDNPHNQTFVIAIQLGLLGTAVLYAMWIAHLLLFRRCDGLAAWLGLNIVVQNIVSGLFNSYLFEFTLGWLYVFGVGVLGGMVLRRHESRLRNCGDDEVGAEAPRELKP
jgi:O-antigen ligase